MCDLKLRKIYASHQNFTEEAQIDDSGRVAKLLR